MASAAPQRKSHPEDWAGLIGQEQWEIYEAVMDAAAGHQIPFALGGAFGLATYIGSWRNTKDLDLYVLPRDREAIIAVLDRVGLSDYYAQVPYDRRWIYRGTLDGVIVDVIWAMANQRVQVDGWWMSGPDVHLRGRSVKVAPAEVMLWDKLYIVQRERCDWPDVMNLLYAQGLDLDWEAVLQRLEDDTPLLASALSMFRWLSPGVALRLPPWLWERVDLPAAPNRRRLPTVNHRRAALLDTRPWYAQERPSRKK